MKIPKTIRFIIKKQKSGLVIGICQKKNKRHDKKTKAISLQNLIYVDMAF
jgi:hypothetical protein